MDKNAVKKFAVNARRKLIDSVSQKAYGLGISKDEIKEVEQIPNGSRIKINNYYVYLTDIETEHRERLIEQIEYKGYEQVMEEVAYTWFNRIIAIRFMEVNDYLPTRVRVLSSEDENKVEPDAVTQALNLVEDLGLDREKIYNYQDNNDIEGLFKYVFIKQCNVLGKIMPVMFEKIQDYTELLLPDNLLVEGSVIRDLINDIKEEDFRNQVEIIGWLYQYYISEKKDEVFADLKKNKKITKENIPAATQLFTPDWIVKYMVENSLGRLWLEGHPNEALKSGWEYYLEEAEQEPDVEKELKKIREESKKLSPEDITVLDPAMGSGHILVYAFDVLYQIYLSAGYSEREIPRLILEKNLYGLDIDDRAGQLAYFALIMKARSYSRRFFRDIGKNPIELNVCAIKESNKISEEDIEYFANGDEELKRDVEYLVEVFTDAKEYGSILKIENLNFKKVVERLDKITYFNENLLMIKYIDNILKIISNIAKQAQIMSDKFDICITNPPYMGRNNMSYTLTKFLKSKFKNTSADLSTVFMEICLRYCNTNGYISMINIPSWMFLSTYSNLRYNIITNHTINNMIHLGRGVFGSDFGTTSFVLGKRYISNYKAQYRKLFFKSGEVDSIEQKKKWFNQGINIFYKNQREFKFLKGYIICYWASDKIIKSFKNNKLEQYTEVLQGMQTCDNERFLRYWFEVSIKNIGINKTKYEDRYKWYPYNKGGEYRKWYGNNYYVINFGDNGKEIKQKRVESKQSEFLPGSKRYFEEGLTWSSVTNANFSMRYTYNGYIFDQKGPMCFIKDIDINYLLSFMNSKVVKEFLKILAPTLDFGQGALKQIPLIKTDYKNSSIISKIGEENVDISKYDWDSFEISLDFKKHPLLIFTNKEISLEKSFLKLNDFMQNQFKKLKFNEKQLNKAFIDIYGLQDELTPEVEDKDITIRKADRDRDMKSFISYAVGCMMGRYSLDEEGLVFAGGEFDINRYKTFQAEKYAIIPITDMEYFEDDIVSRFVEFVKVVFGEETLEENLNYIADTECFKRKANETSRDCLRRYFLKGFMEDHVKVYQKRPIYWMFDSGKQNGFKALIYMHRYDENMVAKVRADYLHVLQKKYEYEINRLDNDINSEILSTKEKTTAKKRKEKIQKQLAECKQYDQVIAHVAHQRIAIDLDDGVKVNYQKFQGIEVPQGDGKKDLKQDLLFKVKM